MTEREVAWIEEQLEESSALTPGQIAAAARLLLIAREEQTLEGREGTSPGRGAAGGAEASGPRGAGLRASQEARGALRGPEDRGWLAGSVRVGPRSGAVPRSLRGSFTRHLEGSLGEGVSGMGRL